jgi:MFS family permease
VILLARRLLPAPTETVPHRLDLLGAGLLGLATFCVLFACVEYDVAHDARLAWLGVPATVLFGLFLRRERRLTDQVRDPLVDLRLFRRPSYVAGITLALTFFPAMAGLPLVLALYYQRGLGYTAVESALGVTAYAVGAGISAPLVGRVVTRVGRPLVVAGAVTFGVGAVALALIAPHVPAGHAALALALPLFVMGCGQGAVITPNQTLALMDVDPLMGSTAGGVLQTGQRIGLAIGQAVIGTVFFNSLSGHGSTSYADALRNAVIAALCFIALAIAIGVHDLSRARRRQPSLR